MEAATQHKRPWPDPEPPELAVPDGMRRERFRAMGTTIALLLPAAQADDGATAVRALFAAWEQTLSRFRPESELSVLNARAGEPVAVSALLYAVVDTALAAARATDGLFDPTLLRQLVSLGYDRSFETLPAHLPRLPGSLAVAGPGGGWRGIALDPSEQRITLPPGVMLDLGGIAKGMAVDAALALLAGMGIGHALVNAGGDLAVLGRPPGGAAWPIAVPLRQGAQTVALKRGALATSGVGRRRWRQGREERHHLLDPRSGLPARSGLWSSSVGAEHCVQAEVAAKAACLLGPADGARFLEARGLSGLLVGEDGACHTAGAWPTPPGQRPLTGVGFSRRGKSSFTALPPTRERSRRALPSAPPLRATNLSLKGQRHMGGQYTGRSGTAGHKHAGQPDTGQPRTEGHRTGRHDKGGAPWA